MATLYEKRTKGSIDNSERGGSSHIVPELSSIESFRHFYLGILGVLRRLGTRFLIGGSYALAAHTGIARTAKDVDLFVAPDEFDAMMTGLWEAGYRVEKTFPHWLGKVRHREYFVDVICSSGNGLCDVDDEWFCNAPRRQLDGHFVDLVPPEEMIWTKAFVMERDRYDGADIIHLIHACWQGMNWDRLLRRFGTYWEVLFSHLVLFSFVYPEEKHKIPQWLWEELIKRFQSSRIAFPSDHQRLCRGSLLSWDQFLIPIHSWKYKDARLLPGGNLTQKNIAEFTQKMEKNWLVKSQWWAKS